MVEETAAERFIIPALKAYRLAQRRACFVTPGGVLLKDDLRGIRRRVAREHGITPEDLQRWWDLMTPAQRAALDQDSA